MNAGTGEGCLVAQAWGAHRLQAVACPRKIG